MVDVVATNETILVVGGGISGMTAAIEAAQAQIKKIIESAYDFGAEMIVTPCPVCQMNVEVYQGQINKKYGTKFNIPVVCYSQLMAVAYGASAKGETERSRAPSGTLAPSNGHAMDGMPRACKRNTIAQRSKPVWMATLCALPGWKRSRRRSKSTLSFDKEARVSGFFCLYHPVPPMEAAERTLRLRGPSARLRPTVALIRDGQNDTVSAKEGLNFVSFGEWVVSLMDEIE